ncbi:MAG: lipopolysaccharide biosynthesis protein [Gaiellaceae bacterium MAG52_C11]|nr:lipopolysaccharide biosynthesis protein [Candidatus Gaiellasilicea maunaloa]
MSAQMRRLGKHSAIYGLGGIVSRVIAVFLLPLYTRYLEPSDFGAVGLLVGLSAVLVTILRAGISSAFFRFYFDAKDSAERLLVLRTSFWFTMASATAGLAAGLLLAEPLADLLLLDDANLVRAAFVGIWAQMNYEQLTALFRVEERSGLFVVASLANIAITIATTLVLVVGYDQGALGVIVGNFIGTLVVYLALLGFRRAQLGLQLSRPLLREMNRFGVPLVPSALALIALSFGDRFFLNELVGAAEVGRYELGVRIASAMVLLITAFRTAWPAFAYSIEDDDEAKRTYAFVLTYLVAAASWLALALGLLSPWLVRLLATPEYYEGGRVVALLAFGSVAYAGYIVMAIGVGRAKRTKFNWAITGAAAALSVVLNVLLVPRYELIGSGIAAASAYAAMFLGMCWYAQRVFPTPYQWRRVATAAGGAVALTVLGKLLDVPLAVALALVAAYPLVLLLLGFTLPAERARLRRLVPR